MEDKQRSMSVSFSQLTQAIASLAFTTFCIWLRVKRGYSKPFGDGRVQTLFGKKRPKVSPLGTCH